MGKRPARVHPQPSELAAQAWLKSLPELEDVRITAGWDALTGWDSQSPIITLDDVLSGMGEPSAAANCVQIDVWSPDRAEEVADVIWQAAAEPAAIVRLMGPRSVPNQGGRVTLDLEFRAS